MTDARAAVDAYAAHEVVTFVDFDRPDADGEPFEWAEPVEKLAPEALAALRAVLDLCDEADRLRAGKRGRDAQALEVFADVVRLRISAALSAPVEPEPSRNS